MSGDSVFAWWPVAISEYRHPHWYPTGRWAWLRRVGRTKTVWWDTFYTELPK